MILFITTAVKTSNPTNIKEIKAKITIQIQKHDPGIFLHFIFWTFFHENVYFGIGLFINNTAANFYRFRKREGTSTLVEYTYFPNVFSAVFHTSWPSSSFDADKNL
jgi:hypothetical protein